MQPLLQVEDTCNALEVPNYYIYNLADFLLEPAVTSTQADLEPVPPRRIFLGVDLPLSFLGLASTHAIS